FEYVWKTVLDKHWDPKLNGLDWQSVHDELRPKIEAANTRDEARAVIASMLARLNQTHFGVFPGEVYQQLDVSEGPRAQANAESDTGEATPGIDVRVIDRHAVVTSVEPGSAAELGVRPGWEIVRVNGVEIAPVLRSVQEQFAASTLVELHLTRSVLTRLQGPAGTSAHIEFLDRSDRAVALDIARVRPRGKVVRFGNMPPGYFWSEWRKARPDIGYLRFNEFMDPDGLSKTFEEAIQGCRECKGFVIDVRGNPGGIGGLAMGVAGWFIDQSGVRLGTEYLRGLTINFVVFPRSEPFRGPLAVLVDGCSASTAEIFAGGLKDVKRARIFGTRTAGAALPSVISKLPNGDGFQYAIANYISEGGQPLEGIGVVPDEEVHPTRRQLLAGQDPILDAALEWIQKKHR
ncbi:MAG TPA: S41 family peptidase, partial [Bryobacteraceae bacterium]|nr:S41 family peptidase [Bryobacteraceae bacterium]